MTKLMNRVISVFDRKTSMRLAEPEWIAVDDICKLEQIKRKKLFEMIDNEKDEKLGFTCSVRLFIITHLYRMMNGYKPNSKRNKADHQSIYETLKKMA